MMLPSHVLATILLATVVGLAWKRFTPTQWVLALSFGVVIDIDHLVQFPAYVAMNGTAALTPGAMLEWGSAWQGVMHTPWALILVIPVALLYRTAIPLAFWGLHMVQDFVIARHYVTWGGALEWAIVALLALGVVLALRADHARHANGRPLGRHLAATLGWPPAVREAERDATLA